MLVPICHNVITKTKQLPATNSFKLQYRKGPRRESLRSFPDMLCMTSRSITRNHIVGLNWHVHELQIAGMLQVGVREIRFPFHNYDGCHSTGLCVNLFWRCLTSSGRQALSRRDIGPEIIQPRNETNREPVGQCKR